MREERIPHMRQAVPRRANQADVDSLLANQTFAERAAQMANYGLNAPRHAVIGLLLVAGLFAFEIFNFDTTRYALQSLLGDVNFYGLAWATILAIAFCSIDFAGLAYLFAPERFQQESRETWYLMGAWLLGATMNAMMTWWAVSLALLSHNLGNEVLSRAQLLQVVPPFVAALVWLTRILFIAAFTVAGNHLFSVRQAAAEREVARQPRLQPQLQQLRLRPRRAVAVPHTSDELPHFLHRSRPAPPEDPFFEDEFDEIDEPAEAWEWEDRPPPPRPLRDNQPLRERAPGRSFPHIDRRAPAGVQARARR